MLFRSKVVRLCSIGGHGLLLVWILLCFKLTSAAAFVVRGTHGYSNKISHPKLKKVSINGFRVLFTGLTNFFLGKIFIKNRSHDTIHIFKNYFVTMFSVFSNK